MVNLVCPVCKNPLVNNKVTLSCNSCNQSYPIIVGIPTFINLQQFEDEEKQYRKPTFQKEKPHIRELNFNIRYSPTEILIKRSFRNKSGLDIGVGSGINENFQHIYNKVSKDIIGVDVSFSGAKKFKKNYPDCPIVLAKNLPFSDRVFDFITASGLIHHLIGQPKKNIIPSFI